MAVFLKIAAPISLSSLLLSALPASSADAVACAVGECDVDGGAAALGLLQRESSRHHVRAAQATEVAGEVATATHEARDLVLQHIPYNFGHTIEKVAGFGSGPQSFANYGVGQIETDRPVTLNERWRIVNSVKQQDGEIWGHMNPNLGVKSEKTGCPMYFTPGKHWPKDLAESYFGNQTIFGMLRDPYERLVAMFRGNFGDYGGSYPEFFATCDVNGAVRKMMTTYLSGDIYSGECCFLPQAEYFDAPFGISLPVDNRKFPDSMNEVFADHGYTNMNIKKDDILHVTGCTEVWSGDLDCETKALVRKVYARDFELLCTHFGYCEYDENCCLEGVPMMCPSNLTAKRETATSCA